MSFSLDITNWVKKAKGRSDKVIKKVVIDLGTSIIMKNPVGNPDLWKSPAPAGYVGGRSRANWQYGNGVMPSGTIDAEDQTGQKTIAALIGKVSLSDVASVHWIANSLPYIVRLENGWSKQAPAGMVGLTVTEFQQIVKRAANERT